MKPLAPRTKVAIRNESETGSVERYEADGTYTITLDTGRVVKVPAADVSKREPPEAKG